MVFLAALNMIGSNQAAKQLSNPWRKENTSSTKPGPKARFLPSFVPSFKTTKAMHDFVAGHGGGTLGCVKTP